MRTHDEDFPSTSATWRVFRRLLTLPLLVIATFDGVGCLSIATAYALVRCSQPCHDPCGCGCCAFGVDPVAASQRMVVALPASRTIVRLPVGCGLVIRHEGAAVAGIAFSVERVVTILIMPAVLAVIGGHDAPPITPSIRLIQPRRCGRICSAMESHRSAHPSHSVMFASAIVRNPSAPHALHVGNARS
jgi:hypothetical protein